MRVRPGNAPGLAPIGGALLLALVLGGGLSGCESISGVVNGMGREQAGPAASPLPGDGEMETLVAYAEWLGRQGPGELPSLFREAGELHHRHPTPLNKVNLAMLLNVPGTGFQNDAQALLYLQEALNRSSVSQGELKQFARVQIAALKFRQQMEVVYERQTRDRQQQLDVLQQQLSELKSIERGMVDRQEKLE